MFHLHNGDSTAGTLRNAGFPGVHFAFREALTTGPVPDTYWQDEWFAMRARHLSDAAEPGAETVGRELRLQHETLLSLNSHQEIVLWFEHDLFCQVHLIYLLNLFAQHSVAPAKLSLICINQFPGVADFRGLGQLTAAQLASLLDTRHEISAAELQLAQRAWTAYCADDPRELIALLDSDTAALPFLSDALSLHVARFPSTFNGLGMAEQRLLTLIAEGFTEYPKLCPKFFAVEPTYGLGDLAIQQDLQRMANAVHPLLALTGFSEDCGWLEVQCQLTDIGQKVLAGQADFVQLNGLDQWLGGVHLTPANLWRWHEAERKLTLG